jgi:hypothetical protein
MDLSYLPVLSLVYSTLASLSLFIYFRKKEITVVD